MSSTSRDRGVNLRGYVREIGLVHRWCYALAGTPPEVI
jgi:hypothetical protein